MIVIEGIYEEHQRIGGNIIIKRMVVQMNAGHAVRYTFSNPIGRQRFFRRCSQRDCNGESFLPIASGQNCREKQ